MNTPDVADPKEAEEIHMDMGFLPFDMKRIKMDWLKMETEIRNTLATEELAPAMRLQIIDMIVANHTGRGSEFKWEGV